LDNTNFGQTVFKECHHQICSSTHLGHSHLCNVFSSITALHHRRALS